jgi:hypothetical protein
MEARPASSSRASGHGDNKPVAEFWKEVDGK